MMNCILFLTPLGSNMKLSKDEILENLETQFLMQLSPMLKWGAT